MGNSLNSCARDHSLKSPKYSVTTLTASKMQPEDEISEISACEPNLRPTESEVLPIAPDPQLVLSQAIEQIFLLCESGVASTVQFIIDSHPGVETLINDRQECFVTDAKMILTPLQLGAACGHPEVIKTLCRSPVIQVNISDPLFSMTALHLAVHLGQTFAVEALCTDPRVEVNEKNVEGKTAMHMAVEHEYPGIVETILRLRPTADLRIKDFDGNNVLHLAAHHPNVRIMRQLVDHTALVSLYCDYFDGTKDSSKLKPKSKRQIFEAQNYNGETPARVLINAIKRIQKKRSQREAKAAEQTQEPMPEQSSDAVDIGPGEPMYTALQLQHPGEDRSAAESPAPTTGEIALAAPTTSAETTDEFSDDPVLQPTEPPAAQPTVPLPVPAAPLSAQTSADPSPALDSEAEEQDIDVLIECLEILNEATQMSPSQESLSSFGYHSASERRSSFDLDSDATDAGQEEPPDEVVEEEVQDRAAYSWSPPFTPSLDQPDHYCTPKTPRTPKSVNS